MTEFEELLEAQLIAQKLIKRTLTNFNKLAKSKRTVTVIRSRLNWLKRYWETCQVQHAAADEEKRKYEYFANDVFLILHDSVEETSDVLSECLERLFPNVAHSFDEFNGSTESQHIELHLLHIDITQFSGEITKWKTFRDIFESLVSSRIDLSKVQKLHYFKANLTGEASLVLSNISITDANYESAWELLKNVTIILVQ